MKKLISLSLMLSLGLATISPALNAAQNATRQSNPSGWQAAKKWFQSGRNIKALTCREQRAFNALKKKIGIGALVAGVAALLGGAAVLATRNNEWYVYKEQEYAPKNFIRIVTRNPITKNVTIQHYQPDKNELLLHPGTTESISKDKLWRRYPIFFRIKPPQPAQEKNVFILPDPIEHY